jgi:inhibitor of cysteine peptidase
MSHYEVHERDLTRSIALKVGDELVLLLGENPTTGYRWTMEQTAGSVLSSNGSAFAPAAGGLGAAGQRRWSFIAKAVGDTHVELKLARSGGEDAALQRALAFDVNVSR